VTDDREWKRIVKHFADGFSTRNPNSPKAVLEAFADSVSQTLRQALGGRSIEFADVEDARSREPDDLGSALILAGGLLYRLRVRNEEIQVAFIGAPTGGLYREETDLGDGQVVRTRITYEHPKLTELKESLAFIVLPDEAERYIALRRRLRRWGRSGIRVWGARTF
jgi:hypothetical protein